MRRIIQIGLSTFRESVRSRVIYLLFFFAVGLMLLVSFFGAVTIGDQALVMRDFGLFGISLFTCLYVVLAGASLLHQELVRRTIFNILAKPVRRSEFIVGKYLGLLGTSSFLLLLMTALLSAILFLLEGDVDWPLLVACGYIWLQLVIICAAAIFFSGIVVTPLLSGAFTFGFFLAGRSVNYLLYYLNEGEVGGLSTSLLKGVYVLLPHLAALDISSSAVYGLTPSSSVFLWGWLYACGYSGVLLIVTIVLFQRREFY